MHVNKFNKIFKRNCDEFEFMSGCSEYSSNVKTTKIYNSKIYAKYYEAYFFLFLIEIKKIHQDMFATKILKNVFI